MIVTRSDDVCIVSASRSLEITCLIPRQPTPLPTLRPPACHDEACLNPSYCCRLLSAVASASHVRKHRLAGVVWHLQATWLKCTNKSAPCAIS